LPRPSPSSPPSVDPVRLTPRRVREIGSRLLEWYDREKRDLPWRRTSDPYAILVSEFMLQQTQVATAIPYYTRFLKEFPTVQALASAPEQEVLRLWAGLGYYSRARNLRATANRIVEAHGGKVPDSVAELLFLPGVGSYMAGAVASIAHGIVAAAVDGNVIRVLSRLFRLKKDPSGPRVRRELEDLDMALVPRDRPGDFNQAMMELGARVCAPAAPDCPACPLRTVCEAAREGNPTDYPFKPRRAETVEVEESCAMVRRGERYLVTQRPGQTGRYRSMWEFPHIEVAKGGKTARRAKQTLGTYLADQFGIEVRVEEEWAEIRHQVTHHKIRKRVFRCSVGEGEGRAENDEPKVEETPVRWLTLEEIAALPLAAPQKRILELLKDAESFFGG